MPQAKNSKIEQGRKQRRETAALAEAGAEPAEAGAGANALLWRQIRAEAEQAVADDAVMGTFLRHFILAQPNLTAAVALRLVARLHHEVLDKNVLLAAFSAVFAAMPEAEAILAADLRAFCARDPAAERLIEPLLYYKGFHALQTHRIAHALWQAGRRDFALYLQSRASSVFQTDIHPAAQIGRGVALDHATGLVIGATAIVEDDVLLLHEVTLGSTGKINGDRHPKIRRGAQIGAGAKILGNIDIGEGAKVAANSIVLKNVPPYATVAGVPGRITGCANRREVKERPGRQIKAEQS